MGLLYVGPRDAQANRVLVREDGLHAQLAGALTVANAEASVVALALPAGSLRVGSVLEFQVYGLLTNTTAASTSVLRLRLGATSLAGAIVASSTLTLGIVARTNIPFVINAAFTVRAIGPTGNAIGQLVVSANTATALGNATGPVTAVVAVNTAVATLAELTMVSGAATTTWVVHAAKVRRHD